MVAFTKRFYAIPNYYLSVLLTGRNLLPLRYSFLKAINASFSHMIPIESVPHLMLSPFETFFFDFLVVRAIRLSRKPSASHFESGKHRFDPFFLMFS